MLISKRMCMKFAAQNKYSETVHADKYKVTKADILCNNSRHIYACISTGCTQNSNK